ncbi:PIR Superfamily Protein [Plasmodium ovale curtisi]|uniref:PIR Superfamily Protein n=1 Tax=Plasmodium ovale curtisi TaxID=864141 RepID=A0A1A8WS65_PLAOA|nr:PIR Superfamily Protein [Plasmodium ovale curtisi]
MYDFCRNSTYYEMVVKNIYREEVVENIDNACKSFKNDACLFKDQSAEEICKKILYMYKYLNKAQRKQDSNSTITNDDLNFLNYWLNVKLKSNDIDASICINEFYRAMEIEDVDFSSSKIKLENRLHVIDPDNLENMKLLCELYDNARNILTIMKGEVYPDEVLKSCSNYTEDCGIKYKKAMDKCLNDYDDFYKALKQFKYYYKYGIEEEHDESGCCKFIETFRLPDYDPVLERKQRNIMVGKILSTPLILSFVIPLLYKYTPLGPFIRTKINIVKDRWMNSDETGRELSSLPTDIEENISDNGEYNIGYYSGTN